MTKAELLYKLELEELIGTSFESMIDIFKMKEGDYTYHEKVSDFRACYLIEGHIQRITYTPEGGEFYMDLFEGEIAGVNFSLSKRMVNSKMMTKKGKLFDMDIIAKEDSKIAYLPLEKIMDIQFKGKSNVLEKLMMMGVEEHFKKSKYLLLKNVYSDEEFFIKYLERNKIINTDGTRELSELLNIHQRSLQRFLKKLQEKGILEKSGGRIYIKDQAKLEEYKKRFEK